LTAEPEIFDPPASLGDGVANAAIDQGMPIGVGTVATPPGDAGVKATL